MRALAIALLAAAALSTPASASRHPAQAPLAFIDVAAAPAYPQAAPERRASVRRRHPAPRREARRARPTPRAERRAQPSREAAGTPAIVQAIAAPAAAAARSAAVLGEMLGVPEGWEDGLSTPAPIVVAGRRPQRIEGEIAIGTLNFRFVSGGAGWSIPYGDWPITPGDVGSWGARHGAIGVNHDDCVYDRQLGRCREGVEIHADYDGRTAGCVGVERFAEAKRAILAMVDKFGRAFLHVWPGHVSVTPERSIGTVIALAAPRVEERRREARRRYRYRRVASR